MSNELSEPRTITVGSRRSKLAMIQTRIVIDELKRHYQNFDFIIKNIDTIGDNILDKPLAKIGEKALFTRELEEELLAGTIDIIVHSLKDLPTTLPEKCCIGAILKREDPSDSLVFRQDLRNIHQNFESILKELQHIKTFGTSSLRRIAQLKSLSSRVVVKDIRGNLNTRLEKLDNHQVYGYDCLILATSGLKRAGFSDRITLRLVDNWYHAVSQGALGIECRSNDDQMIRILEPLIDQRSALECTAERVFMKCLEGGCSVPIGVRTYWDSPYRMTLRAKVLSPDAKESLSSEGSRDLDDQTCVNNNSVFKLSDYTDISLNIDIEFSLRLKNSVLLGQDVAQKMINLGVKRILSQKITKN